MARIIDQQKKESYRRTGSILSHTAWLQPTTACR